ncbi:nose resistant to fluoxetine protein 6-like [Plodia interpunctella]|uniref:nose resistant to fluoxetine protein 6-like n=1 Tax=Plodia interpunctella TaxID=58824 RepID=UPI002367DB3E|nr:nose resistant to fluoxetine protein 6-like [Plodia interpunctella]
MLFSVFLTFAFVFGTSYSSLVDDPVSQRLDSLVESTRPTCESNVINNNLINNEEIKNISEFIDNIQEADAILGTLEVDKEALKVSPNDELTKLVNFPSLNAAVSNIKDAECREQGLKALIGLLLRKPWALQMYDASANSFQVLSSNFSYDLGNFDGCLNIADSPDNGLPIETQYCLASITLNDAEEKKVRTGRDDLIRWAICVPSVCQAEDVQAFIAEVLSRTSVGNSTTVQLTDRNCSSKRPWTVNNLDTAFLIFCVLLGAMLILGTLYDLMTCGKKNGTIGHDLMVSFSLISNFKKIMSTKANDSMGLHWVSGLKSLSMFVTVAGHALLFISSGPVENPEVWDEFLRKPISSIPLSNHLLVDTFLFLSAFLFSYLLLDELEKKRGKVNTTIVFILRYVKMTPSYLMVLLFYMTWFPKLGSGPLWKDRLLLEQDRCMQSWWANLLYINNYVNTDTMCMFQSWYLAVDTQLAFFAPFFIYSLWRCGRAAPRILGLTIVASAIIPFVYTYVYQLDPTLMFYAKEYRDFAGNAYFKAAYIKTELRIVTYVMGIATGYILHQIRLKNYSFSRCGKIFGWAMTIVFSLVTTLPLTVFYQDWHEYNAVEAAAFMSLHKLTWGIVNGWLMLMFTMGDGGWTRCVLTWKYFVPISKLTFSAYLVNVVVELTYVGLVRYPLHATFTSLVTLALSHVLYTFMVAFVLCITFESPLHGVLKVVFAKLLGSGNSKKKKQDQSQASNEISESKSKDE